MTDRLTLIKGPPGTGKTRVLAAIVTNWYKMISGTTEKILVCCPSNFAADLCAELLCNIPMI